MSDDLLNSIITDIRKEFEECIKQMEAGDVRKIIKQSRKLISIFKTIEQCNKILLDEGITINDIKTMKVCEINGRNIYTLVDKNDKEKAANQIARAAERISHIGDKKK